MGSLGDNTRAPCDAALVLGAVADQTHRVADFCDLLEAIADDLPRKAKPVWREIIRLCDAILDEHLQTFAQVIVPALLRRTRDDAHLQTVLTQLHAEYRDESARLPELAALLSDNIGPDEDRMTAETLGYALRSFFTALRRQAAWESNVLLPLAATRLSPADLEAITEQFATGRRGNVVRFGQASRRGTV
ncbi:MAG: hemerythrin domain-containing protein [Pseudomonadota bacterium]